jgi:hypothetical protein
MKYLKKASLLATAAFIPILPILAAVRLVSASGSATLSLAPSGTTVAQGSSFNVDIHEDSGSDTVNAVQANLTYSGSLTFVSITSSADFSINAQSTGGGGTVSIGRGTTTPVSGDHVVATVRFTASGSGTANIGFDTGSAVVRSNDNGAEALTENSGSYTITSSSTMSLSPATKTVSQGTSFDVAVYEDSGSDTVNAVQANLSYPSSLTVTSITPNSSAWPIEAENTGSGGTVKIGRGTTTPVSGSQLIATVKFTAAGTGNAQVAFVTGSGIIRSSDNTAEPSTNTGGSYTITSTGSTSPASGSSSGTTSKKSTSAPAPPKSYTTAPASQSSPATAPADTAGPMISGIKATNLTTSSATISWQTSEPATSEVDYGLSTNFILNKMDSGLTTSHSLALDSKELIGHKTYHFVVKSTDAAGNQSVSEDMTFSTGGLQITKTEVAAAAAATLIGGGLWAAAAGGLKFGGGMIVSAGGIYKEPKPIIVGGGSPPPPPAPVVQPQTVQKSAPTAKPQTAQKPAPAAQPQTTKKPAASAEPQTPGKIVGPKNPPASQAVNQTKPKWVK